MRKFFLTLFLLAVPLLAQNAPDVRVIHINRGNITLYTNTPTPGAPDAPIIAVPTRPTMTVVTIPGRIFWTATNAYDCSIENAARTWGSGELPVSGNITVPPGTYVVTATGERHLTVRFYVDVP